MSDKKKKKKQKTVYIDDGRTIADMSGINQGKIFSGAGIPPINKSKSTFKEKMQTYFSAVKMMFLPMLATLGIICVAFLILYLLLSLAG